VFRRELVRAQSVTWRDLALHLALPAEVAVRRVHRVSPAIAPIEPDDESALALGDLEAEQDDDAGGLSLLIELIVPSRPAGTYRLAEVTLRGRAPDATSTAEIAHQDVLVRYTETPSLARQTEERLMTAVQRVSAFRLHAQAIEDAQRGNVEGATRRLRRAGERLIALGEEDLGHTMLAEAELMVREGKMSREGTKRLRYGTRRLH